MKKRILSWLLSLVLIAQLLPTAGFAAAGRVTLLCAGTDVTLARAFVYEESSDGWMSTEKGNTSSDGSLTLTNVYEGEHTYWISDRENAYLVKVTVTTDGTDQTFDLKEQVDAAVPFTVEAAVKLEGPDPNNIYDSQRDYYALAVSSCGKTNPKEMAHLGWLEPEQTEIHMTPGEYNMVVCIFDYDLVDGASGYHVFSHDIGTVDTSVTASVDFDPRVLNTAFQVPEETRVSYGETLNLQAQVTDDAGYPVYSMGFQSGTSADGYNRYTGRSSGYYSFSRWLWNSATCSVGTENALGEAFPNAVESSGGLFLHTEKLPLGQDGYTVTGEALAGPCGDQALEYRSAADSVNVNVTMAGTLVLEIPAPAGGYSFGVVDYNYTCYALVDGEVRRLQSAAYNLTYTDGGTVVYRIPDLEEGTPLLAVTDDLQRDGQSCAACVTGTYDPSGTVLALSVPEGDCQSVAVNVTVDGEAIPDVSYSIAVPWAGTFFAPGWNGGVLLPAGDYALAPRMVEFKKEEIGTDEYSRPIYAYHYVEIGGEFTVGEAPVTLNYAYMTADLTETVTAEGPEDIYGVLTLWHGEKKAASLWSVYDNEYYYIDPALSALGMEVTDSEYGEFPQQAGTWQDWILPADAGTVSPELSELSSLTPAPLRSVFGEEEPVELELSALNSRGWRLSGLARSQGGSGTGGEWGDYPEGGDFPEGYEGDIFVAEPEAEYFFPTLRYKLTSASTWTEAALDSWLRADLGVLPAGEYVAELSFTAPEGVKLGVSSLPGTACAFTVSGGAQIENRVSITAAAAGKDKATLTVSGLEGAVVTAKADGETLASAALPQNGRWTGEAPLTSDGTHSFTVTSVLEGGTTAEAEATLTKTSAPPAGLTLAAQADYNAVKLSFTAPEGASRLFLYRGEELIATLSGSAAEYTDRDLEPEREVSYSLWVLTGNTLAGAASASAVPLRRDTQVPTLGSFAADAAVITDATEAVTLSWSPAADDVALGGYRLLRRNSAGYAPWTTIYETEDLTQASYSYTDSSLPALHAGEGLVYALVAYDKAGNESSADDAGAQITLMRVSASLDLTLTLPNARYARNWLSRYGKLTLKSPSGRAYVKSVNQAGDSGTYAFPGLDSGDYTLTLSLNGTVVSSWEAALTYGSTLSVTAPALRRVKQPSAALSYAPDYGSGWTVDEAGFLTDGARNSAFWWPEDVSFRRTSLYGEAEDGFFALEETKTLTSADFPAENGYTYTFPKGAPASPVLVSLEYTAEGSVPAGLMVVYRVYRNGSFLGSGDLTLDTEGKASLLLPEGSGYSLELISYKTTLKGITYSEKTVPAQTVADGSVISVQLGTYGTRTLYLDFSSTVLPEGVSLAGLTGYVDTWNSFTLDENGRAQISMLTYPGAEHVVCVNQRYLSDDCLASGVYLRMTGDTITSALRIIVYEEKSYALTFQNPCGESLEGVRVEFRDNYSTWTETLSDPEGDGVAVLELSGVNVSWMVRNQALGDNRRSALSQGKLERGGAVAIPVCVDRSLTVSAEELPEGWRWALYFFEDGDTGEILPKYIVDSETFWVSGRTEEGKTWAHRPVTVAAFPVPAEGTAAYLSLTQCRALLPEGCVQRAADLSAQSSLSFAAPAFGPVDLPESAEDRLIPDLLLFCRIGDTGLFSGTASSNAAPQMEGAVYSFIRSSYFIEVRDEAGDPIDHAVLALFDRETHNNIQANRQKLGNGRYRLDVPFEGILPVISDSKNVILCAGYGDIFFGEFARVGDMGLAGVYSFWTGQENAYIGPADYLQQELSVTLRGKIYQLAHNWGDLITSVKSVTPQGDGTLLVRLEQSGADDYESLIVLPSEAQSITLNGQTAALRAEEGVTGIYLPKGNNNTHIITFTIPQAALEEDHQLRAYILTRDGLQLQFTVQLPCEVFSYGFKREVSSREVLFRPVGTADKDGTTPAYRVTLPIYRPSGALWGADYSTPVTLPTGTVLLQDTPKPENYTMEQYREDYAGGTEGVWLSFETTDKDLDFQLALRVDGVPVEYDPMPQLPPQPGYRAADGLSGSSFSMGYGPAASPSVGKDFFENDYGWSPFLPYGTWDGEMENFWMSSSGLFYHALYNRNTGEGALFLPMAEPEHWPHVYEIEILFKYRDEGGEELILSFTDSVTAVKDAPVLEKWQYEHLNGTSSVTSIWYHEAIRSTEDYAYYQDHRLDWRFPGFLDWNNTNVFRFRARFDDPEGVARAYAVADLPEHCENQWFELSYNSDTGCFEGVGVLGDALNPPRDFCVVYELAALEPYDGLPTLELSDLFTDREAAPEEDSLPEGWTAQELASENGWTLPETYEKWDLYFAAIADLELTEEEIDRFTDENGRLYFPAVAICDETGETLYVQENYYNFTEAEEADFSYSLVVVDEGEYVSRISQGVGCDAEKEVILLTTDAEDPTLLLPIPADISSEELFPREAVLFSDDRAGSALTGADALLAASLRASQGVAGGPSNLFTTDLTSKSLRLMRPMPLSGRLYGIVSIAKGIINTGGKKVVQAVTKATAQGKNKLIDTGVVDAYNRIDPIGKTSSAEGLWGAYGMAAEDMPDWFPDLPEDDQYEYMFFRKNAAISSILETGAGLTGIGTVGAFLFDHFWKNGREEEIMKKWEKIGRGYQRLNRRNQLLQEYLRNPERGRPGYCIDPSGYVFEGAENNRLAGVTATVYQYTGSTAGWSFDSDGILAAGTPGDAKWEPWNSEYYGEGPNPNTSDAQGVYGWDVLVGAWKVVFEKEGYYTAESSVMNVPPAHTDVNVSMVSIGGASLESAGANPEYAELVFDKPVRVEDVEALLLVNGESVAGRLTAVDSAPAARGHKQASGDGDVAEGALVARVFRAALEGASVGDALSLSAAQGIRSYNGVAAEGFDLAVTVAEKTDPITALSYTGSTGLMAPGDTRDLAAGLEISGTEGTLSWTSLTPELASVSADGVMTALSTEYGGSAILQVSVPGSEVGAVVVIPVDAMEPQPVIPQPEPEPEPEPEYWDDEEDTAPETTQAPEETTTAEPERPFTDVLETSWFYEAVYYCYDKGYFKGTSEKEFTPGDTMTREMFAAVLYRIAGEPKLEGEKNAFSDVVEGKYYTDAVLWASGEGIIQGYGDGTFGTGDPVTREQMVVLFWRLSGKPAAEEADLSAFADAEEIHSWAWDAFAWAVGAGVVRGKGNGILDPRGDATRAEVAQIVMNYDTIINAPAEKG